jgi:hypothetical protein
VLTTSAMTSKPVRPTTAATLNGNPCRSDVLSLRGTILKNRADLVWATLGESGLGLALAAIGWATNQPLIFTSLGSDGLRNGGRILAWDEMEWILTHGEVASEKAQPPV